MYLQRNNGPAPTPAELTVSVSFDDGATWQNAPLVRKGDRWNAVLSHPPRGGYVSLRAHAADQDGNSVDQTIIHAYALG